MALNGLYFGLDFNDLRATEEWLGTKAQILAVHTGRANWWDWSNSVDWQINRMKDQTAEFRWSIPMFANGGTLKDAASHMYDSHYLEAAAKLAKAYAGDEKIIVRVGEEFNANWMPWAAAGKEQDYVGAYRNFVDAFRSVSDKFVFEWNVNVGGSMDPSTAYPGDDYVDIVGMDVYWDSKWGITDPVKAFDYYKNTKYGLQWLEDFADAHGKPTAYSEWGVNAANGGDYIKLMYDWFDKHDVAYQIYWDYTEFKQTGDSDGTAAAMQSAFASGLKPVSDSLSLLVPQSGQVAKTGTKGNDAITGNDRANIINGGAGDDMLTGAGGADTFVFAPGSGKDVIADFARNGEADTIDLSAYLTAGRKATVAASGRDAVISLSSGEKITLKDTVVDSLVATKTGYEMGIGVLNQTGWEQKTNSAAVWAHVWDKVDAVGDKDWYKVEMKKGQDMRIAVEAGGSGMGTLEDAKVTIYDAQGNVVAADDNSGSGLDAMARFTVKETGNYYIVVESANGGAGNYMIDIATGNMIFSDVAGGMTGTKVNDTLVGNKLDNVMTGGAGNDRFQMGIGGGKDVITDFSKGDLIDVMAFKQAGYNPTISKIGGDTLLSYATGETIKLLGIDPGQLKDGYWGYSIG